MPYDLLKKKLEFCKLGNVVQFIQYSGKYPKGSFKFKEKFNILANSVRQVNWIFLIQHKYLFDS